MVSHRAPTQLEAFVNNTINYIIAAFRNTIFEYWLLDRQGQVKTVFFTFLIGIVSWLLLLEYSSCAAKKEATSEFLVQDPAPEMEEVASFTSSPQLSISPISSDGIDTNTDYNAISFMSQLAPAGHRPTNANLGNGVARPLNDREYVIQVPLPRCLRRTPAPEVAAERELDAHGEYSQVSMLNQLDELEGSEAERMEQKTVGKEGGRAVLV